MVLVAVVVTSCVGSDPVAGGTASGGTIDAGTDTDAAGKACAPTDRTCVGVEMRGCAPDGSGFSPTPLEICASEALCKSGLAGGKYTTPACADGELKCEGADRFPCLADRTAFSGAKSDTCAAPTPACVAGKCVQCETGTQRCSGKTPEACVSDAWQAKNACTGTVLSMCAGGECIDARFARWPMPNEAGAERKRIERGSRGAGRLRRRSERGRGRRLQPRGVAQRLGGAPRRCRCRVADGRRHRGRERGRFVR